MQVPLGPQESASQMAPYQFSSFCTAHLGAKYEKHTKHAVCNMCCNELHLCTAQETAGNAAKQ